MQKKYDVILADTSCFILLDKIGELEMLRDVFGTITTTEEIALEFGKALPDWVLVTTLANKRYIELLSFDVDFGEASIIAMALDSSNALLILDDYKARKMAEKLDLTFTGTLGIFLKAKELGLISSVRFVLEKVQKTNFRFSAQVVDEILSLSNE